MSQKLSAPMSVKEKFELGRVVATPAVVEVLSFTEMLRAVARHASGDWGDVEASDRKANELGLVAGERLFSAYTVNDVAFWVITEADRSATTVLLPGDY